MSRLRKTRQRDGTSVGLYAAAELLDTRLVNAFDHNAADHGAWDCGVAKPPQHQGLDTRGRGIEDAVLDVIARKDRPDLFAIGAPPGIVQGDTLAAAGLGRSRRKTEKRGRHGRSNKNRGRKFHHALFRKLVVSAPHMLHIVLQSYPFVTLAA
jgi:hypothetical protein